MWAERGLISHRESAAPSAAVVVTGGVAVLASIAVAYGWILSLGHLGWDTWPMIASSRVLEWQDLIGNLSEELMDGRYIDGHFYRPLANCSFALDHALYGVAPGGYHATDLLIFCGAVLSIGGLMFRLFGRSWGVLLAPLIFALHPLQMEILPASSRRPDSLVVLFTLLGLCVLPLRVVEQRRLRTVLAGLCALLAISSKETGAVALPVFLAASLLLGPGGSPSERLVRSIRDCSFALLFVAAYLAARLVVLDGIGGHEASSLSGALGQLPGVVRHYLELLVLPQSALQSPVLHGALLVALLVGGVAPIAVAFVRILLENEVRPGPGFAALFVFLISWGVCIAGLTATSGELRSWYGAAFLPVYSLLCGAALELALGELRCGSRIGAGVLLALVLTIVIAPLRYSPLVHRYTEWERLSERQDVYLRMFEARVRATKIGGASLAPGTPFYEWREGKVGLERVSGMSHYSLRAYAEVVLPDFPVRIVPYRRRAGLQPAPDVITIGVTARLPGPKTP